MKKSYNITGMTCSGCKATVYEKLSSLDEVTNVEINLENGEVIIYSNDQISLTTLKRALPPKYIITDKNNSEKSLNEEKKLKQLKPLFLILTYITITSILINYNKWDSGNAMLDFMGLFFIIFSFFKILDVAGFKNSFKMYDPIAKIIPIYGWIYPFIEIILGIMFLMRLKINIALIITLLILGITSIGVLETLLNKKKIKCACLGSTLNLPMTEATLIENIIMIFMAISLII